jgi:site-specific DNA-methyltransferase (adenine-specific)
MLAGDSLELLPTLPAGSVDAVITDPPYALGLRGTGWDRPSLDGARSSQRSDAADFAAWTAEWARGCLRLLKPGGYLLAFGAPRTAHRLACGIEDASFELRDQLVWLYGSGVPKSGLRDGRGSALSPAHEPIILARKPLTGSLDENEHRFGTGRLGIDDTRTPSPDRPLGRWPSNLVLSHERACSKTGCVTRCAAARIDRSRPRVRPSRFYYCAKASRSERDAGCEQLPARRMRIYGPKDTAPRRNTHPTVKPVALMRWLIRLGCPPGGLVLDPFAGSGSTGIAALAEGRRFLGIEREPEYVRIALARLEHAATDGGTVDATPDRGRFRRTVIQPLERRN